MKVYVILYGCIDASDESFSSVWANKDEALQACIDTANEVVDGDEDCVVVIEDDRAYVTQAGVTDGDRLDWWRVKEEPVR